jgi:hypothetical protein
VTARLRSRSRAFWEALFAVHVFRAFTAPLFLITFSSAVAGLRRESGNERGKPDRRRLPLPTEVG